MAGEGTGAVSSFRIKNQTAVDTIPTASLRSVPFSNVTPRVVLGGEEESSHLGTAAATDAIYLSPSYHEIDYDCELGYKTLDDLLCGIVGTPTVTGDGAATAYANVYAPISSPLYKYGQVVEGDIPTTKAQGYKNLLPVEVTISWSADNPKGTVKAKYVGQINTSAPGTGETLVTTTLVTVAHVPLLNSQWTIWNMGVGADTTYCVSSGTIKLSRDYDAKRGCMGSTGYKPVIFTSPLKSSFEGEVEFDDAALFAAMVAQTLLTGFRLKAVGGATGIGSDFYTLEVKSLQSYLTAWELPINTNGKLKQKVTAKGFGNSGTGQTYQAINFKLTNNVNGATL